MQSKKRFVKMQLLFVVFCLFCSLTLLFARWYNVIVKKRLVSGGLLMKKMMVLIGNYGSGKSELAAERGERTELLDLDMVNTYFRLTERGKQVQMKEIRLVSPNFANSGIETLSLPAEVASAFAMDWDTVIFDVGGDAVGSTALGRYHEDFLALEEGALEVLNVVNIRRPLAGTVEKVIHLQEEMQIHSRLKITGMINNTNLAEVTGPDELRDGYEIIREVSRKTGVPVKYTSGKAALLEQFLSEGHDPKYIGEPLPIDIYMRRDWNSWIASLPEKRPQQLEYL